NGDEIDERPHRIVHGHQLGIGIERAERVLDGLLAAVAAFHGAHFASREFAGQHAAHPVEVFGAHGHHDLAHAFGGNELAHRMQQDGRAFEQHELLPAGACFFGGALAHARDQSCRGQYDGDFHVFYDSIVVFSGGALVMGCGSLLRTGRSCFSSGSATCIRSSNLPKIIFPAVVCSTLVTEISIVLEIIFLALSTTTMVPSSRKGTPWLYSLPSLRMKTRMVSPGSTMGFSELASSLMLRTSTPWSWATLFRLKSLVMTLQSKTLASSISFMSPSRVCGKSSSTICTLRLAIFCTRARMSSPRRPRLRFMESAESATSCSSRSTNCGITSTPSRNPVSAISAMRPSMITLVSRILCDFLDDFSPPKIPPSADRFSMSPFFAPTIRPM